MILTGSLGFMQEVMLEVHSQETPVKFLLHSQTPSTQLPWPGEEDGSENSKRRARGKERRNRERKRKTNTVNPLRVDCTARFLGLSFLPRALYADVLGHTIFPEGGLHCTLQLYSRYSGPFVCTSFLLHAR